jgi:hypothetical protein
LAFIFCFCCFHFKSIGKNSLCFTRKS